MLSNKKKIIMKDERKIKRILLVNPPGTIHVEADGTKQVKECPAPLGLAYLAAQMIKKNLEVTVYDMIVENFYQETRISADTILFGDTFEQFKKVLENLQPDLVGISCILSSRSPSVLKLCEIAKQYNKGIITVVGGHHATALPEHMLKGNVDFVMLGEADLSFPKLIDSLNNNCNLSKVDGIVYKDKNEIIFHKRTDYVKDLDSLPRPAWNIVGLEKYWQGFLPMGIPLKRKKYGLINTSRGCPHICEYCAVPLHCGERNFRTRDVNDVIDEIKWLVDSYGIEEIQFMDDNFFVNKGRMKELCRLLIKNFPDMYFAVPTGTDLPNLDFELIELLKKAGFYFMMLGIETGSLDLQGKFVDKRINIDQSRAKIKLMKQLELEVSGFFMLGFPGETREQIQQTVDLATSLDLDRIYLIMVNPLPGSRIYTYCLDNNLLYDDFDVTKIRYSTTYIKNNNISREELHRIRKNVWHDYMGKRIDIKEYNERGWAK